MASLGAARKELGNVLAIHADAGDIAAQKKIAAEIQDNFGGLDAIFINAGIGDFRPLAEWDEAGFDRSAAVNLRGRFSDSSPVAVSR
ncbi:Oxidoreductase ucpA EC 1 CDS [Bradyrhizobium sp.]|uniref:SDR family NAD(P)-dependent oxidoreductase n=1 Tax=Bradyrhizobium sp. TaxID=376 RepID=UPI0007C1B82F|nr:SDR family NAD(P)-dependent oxidoreductase [Bradyrhizobium sp.]CUU20923.1 Oxidoreductase ucpA EC 1 CDS [Bradyrhizobium sp.]